MIIGAHSITYGTDPQADRAFLRDVLQLTHVDVGDGGLIFDPPPGEVTVHPAAKNDVHEFYLMCADVQKFVAATATGGAPRWFVHADCLPDSMNRGPVARRSQPDR